MKKILLASFFVLAIAVSSFAQNTQIEINAFTGWVPASKTAYSYNGYRLKIDQAQNYGIGIGKNLGNGIMVELNYNRFSSTIKQEGGLVQVFPPQPIGVDYYQIGALKSLMDGDKVIPYGLFTLGASRFDLETQDDVWNFAVNAGLGVRYFFSDAIGIRLQARLLMPLYFAGAGFACGSGGCGSGIGMGVEILQADFTGGVVLRVGQ